MKAALVSFDFAELCATLANGVGRHADIRLCLPEPEARVALPHLREPGALMPFPKPRLRQPAAQARTCLRLTRDLRAWDPDVVHLQQGHLYFNHALARLGRRPLVVTVHDATCHPGDRLSGKTPQWAMDRAFRRADRVIVHAEAVREGVVRRGVKRSRVEVLPHPAIGRAASAPAGAPQAPVVLFFGRIWQFMGLRWLIEAEPLLAERVPEVRIVIAGEGEDLEPYRRLMRDPGRYYIRNERISDEERSELFSHARVVVLPYVEASQSGVVPVAHAHARPVVASAVGGIPEAVQDEVTGLLVPPRDPAALADALARVLTEPGLAERMGAAGRTRLLDRAGDEAVGSATVAVYERAIGEAGRGR